MYLSRFIDNLNDPLENKSVLKKLISCYSRRDYYSALISTPIDYIKDDSQVNHIEEDKFYVFLFNQWKTSILNLSKEDLKKLQSKVKCDIKLIIKYVQTIPEVLTKLDVYHAIFGEQVPKEIRDGLDRIWPLTKSSPTWKYVASRYTHSYKKSSFEINHRLYLKMPKSSIYLFVNELITKCEDRDILYEFKFNTDSERQDSVVIYTNDENLSLFASLCEEIKNEHPEIIFGVPPMLTANYKGWLGYGAEPEINDESYNSIRAQIINNVLDEMLCTFYSTPNFTITIGDKKFPIEKYISYLVVKKLVSRMRVAYNEEIKLGNDVSNFDINILNDQQELLKLRAKVSNFIINNFDILKGSTKYASIPLCNVGSKTFTINSDIVRDASIEYFKDSIVEYDPVLIIFKNRILESAKKMGISSKQFAMNDSFYRKYELYKKVSNRSSMIVDSRKADNRRLYDSYFKILEEIYRKKIAGDNKGLDKLFNMLDAYRLSMQRVAVNAIDFADEDFYIRTQYYLFHMTYALNQDLLERYLYLSSLYQNYNQIDKKL